MTMTNEELKNALNKLHKALRAFSHQEILKNKSEFEQFLSDGVFDRSKLIARYESLLNDEVTGRVWHFGYIYALREIEVELVDLGILDLDTVEAAIELDKTKAVSATKDFIFQPLEISLNAVRARKQPESYKTPARPKSPVLQRSLADELAGFARQEPVAAALPLPETTASKPIQEQDFDEEAASSETDSQDDENTSENGLDNEDALSMTESEYDKTPAGVLFMRLEALWQQAQDYHPTLHDVNAASLRQVYLALSAEFKETNLTAEEQEDAQIYFSTILNELCDKGVIAIPPQKDKNGRERALSEPTPRITQDESISIPRHAQAEHDDMSESASFVADPLVEISAAYLQTLNLLEIAQLFENTTDVNIRTLLMSEIERRNKEADETQQDNHDDKTIPVSDKKPTPQLISHFWRDLKIGSGVVIGSTAVAAVICVTLFFTLATVSALTAGTVPAAVFVLGAVLLGVHLAFEHHREKKVMASAKLEKMQAETADSKSQDYNHRDVKRFSARTRPLGLGESEVSLASKSAADESERASQRRSSVLQPE